MIRRARVAALVSAAVVVASCGGGGGGGAVQTRTTTTTTTTTVPVTRSGGGGSVNVAIICTTPSDAAHTLVDAWRAGDRAAATRCGSPAAVATLFAQSGPGAAWTFQQCTGTVCSFSYPQGRARLTVRGSDAVGWIVDQVQLGP